MSYDLTTLNDEIQAEAARRQGADARFREQRTTIAQQRSRAMAERHDAERAAVHECYDRLEREMAEEVERLRLGDIAYRHRLRTLMVERASAEHRVMHRYADNDGVMPGQPGYAAAQARAYGES